MGASAPRKTRRPKLPPELRRILTQPFVDQHDAAWFLGFASRSDVVYKMAAKHRARVAKAVKGGALIDLDVLRPRRNADGSWAEIANEKFGGVLRFRTDMLIEMVYPEGMSLRRWHERYAGCDVNKDTEGAA